MGLDCIVSTALVVESYKRNNYEDAMTRNYVPEHYYGGIKSLLNLNKPLVLFTTEETKLDILDKIPGSEKIKFVHTDYRTLNPYYDTLFEWCKNIIDQKPSAVYCWNPPFATSRLFFMKYAASLGYENIIWMDAGLSNESYIPEEYGGTWHDWNKVNWDNYYPNNEKDFFKPQLAKDIFQLIEKYDNFFIGLKGYIGVEPRIIMEQYYHEKVPNWAMTGGIIGLKLKKILEIEGFYNRLIEYYMENYDRLFTEIEIFTHINHVFDFAKISFGNFMLDDQTDSFFKCLKQGLKDEYVRFNNSYL
tara:strand:+ start:93 stop:1001 length:909 start_codon:yes stop_codon:yes gene_type:complete